MPDAKTKRVADTPRGGEVQNPEGDGQLRPHRSGDRLPVLIVVHQAHSSPGRIGHWLMARGYGLDVRRPRFGSPLPETLAHHAGAIVFGGPMSANDDEPFLRREIEWIGVVLEEQKPFLGICLGAQLLARHLGARVWQPRDGRAEIGYYAIHPTPEGRALADWPRGFYQWHRESFDLPLGAVRLATGELFEEQAFRYGPAAAAVQFHPEITYALINRWTSARPDRLGLPGARSRREHFEGYFTHHGEVGRWLDTFLPRWLAGALAPEGARGDKGAWAEGENGENGKHGAVSVGPRPQPQASAGRDL